MENLLLILLGLLVLSFTWALWLRYQLMQRLNAWQNKQFELSSLLQKRRDTLPYLLEMYRQEKTPQANWQQLADERAKFHDPQPMTQEWELERHMLEFIKAEHVSTPNYLEAEKDILDLSKEINDKKEGVEVSHQAFMTLKAKAPYGVVAKVFGV